MKQPHEMLDRERRQWATIRHLIDSAMVQGYTPIAIQGSRWDAAHRIMVFSRAEAVTRIVDWDGGPLWVDFVGPTTLERLRFTVDPDAEGDRMVTDWEDSEEARSILRGCGMWPRRN